MNCEIFIFSDASFDSDLSNDYAVPPDATSTLIPSTPSRILMASENASLASPRKSMGGIEKALEKSGYLTKLGGKIKSWKKRYFMLKNGTLCYWKSQVRINPEFLILFWQLTKFVLIIVFLNQNPKLLF